jgi:uncharacterized protein
MTEIAALGDITSADWSLALDTSWEEPGSGIGAVVQGAADVNQCVRVILTTPKGSDPLRPTFGADIWQYIDHPINAAIPAVVREVVEAITLWEPRVALVRVTAIPITSGTTQAGAHLKVSVVWRLKLTGNGGAAAAIAPPTETTTLVFPTSPRLSGVS